MPVKISPGIWCCCRTAFASRASQTPRDWSDEILREIRLVYARHTSGESDTSILNRWNTDPNKSTANDGRVDLVSYFAALIQHREQVQTDLGCLTEIAERERLNAKYLRLLAEMLTAEKSQSLLLDDLRRRWPTAQPADASAWAADVRAWQDRLWTFQPVGHLGLIQRWQQPVNPLPESIRLQRQLPDTPGQDSVTR